MDEGETDKLHLLRVAAPLPIRKRVGTSLLKGKKPALFAILALLICAWTAPSAHARIIPRCVSTWFSERRFHRQVRPLEFANTERDAADPRDVKPLSTDRTGAMDKFLNIPGYPTSEITAWRSPAEMLAAPQFRRAFDILNPYTRTGTPIPEAAIAQLRAMGIRVSEYAPETRRLVLSYADPTGRTLGMSRVRGLQPGENVYFNRSGQSPPFAEGNPLPTSEIHLVFDDVKTADGSHTDVQLRTVLAGALLPPALPTELQRLIVGRSAPEAEAIAKRFFESDAVTRKYWTETDFLESAAYWRNHVLVEANPDTKSVALGKGRVTQEQRERSRSPSPETRLSTEAEAARYERALHAAKLAGETRVDADWEGWRAEIASLRGQLGALAEDHRPLPPRATIPIDPGSAAARRPQLLAEINGLADIAANPEAFAQDHRGRGTVRDAIAYKLHQRNALAAELHRMAARYRESEPAMARAFEEKALKLRIPSSRVHELLRTSSNALASPEALESSARDQDQLAEIAELVAGARATGAFAVGVRIRDLHLADGRAVLPLAERYVHSVMDAIRANSANDPVLAERLIAEYKRRNPAIAHLVKDLPPDQPRTVENLIHVAFKEGLLRWIADKEIDTSSTRTGGGTIWWEAKSGTQVSASLLRAAHGESKSYVDQLHEYQWIVRALGLERDVSLGYCFPNGVTPDARELLRSEGVGRVIGP